MLHSEQAGSLPRGMGRNEVVALAGKLAIWPLQAPITVLETIFRFVQFTEFRAEDSFVRRVAIH